MLPEPLAVLVAMDIEGMAIEAALDEQTSSTVLGVRITDGLLHGHRLLLAYSGVGKVNATLATAALATAGARAVVLVGMAGGVSSHVRLGEAIIATDLVQHDVDVSMFGSPLGIINGQTAGGTADLDLSDRLALAAVDVGAIVHRGRITSGDQFIASPKRAKKIAQEFDTLAVEMEGAAVAQACTRLKLPFAVLRWVSDAADQAALTDFPAFTRQIAGLDLAVIKALLLG